MNDGERAENEAVRAVIRTLIREYKAKTGPDPVGPDYEHSSQQG